MTERRTTVDLVAGQKSSGEPVYEEVLVDREGADTYRVVATPALALGTAAGDVIEVDPQRGTFDVVVRGQNLAVQVYGRHALVDEVTDDVVRLGGGLDGRAPGITVFTIPVSAGFPAVEAVFNGLAERHAEIEWYFGNVYDPIDGVTPLGWWE